MKQPKPSGCFLSASNLTSPPVSQTEMSPAQPQPWPASAAPLCSGSRGFPSPFSPEKHPSFQRHHGQFVNILLSPRARRNQILQSPAQHNRRSAPLSLCCGGCIFLGVALLTKHTWSQSKHPLPSLWLPASSGKAWPWIPLERGKMDLMHWTAPGWLWRCLGSNPPASWWVYGVPVQEGLREVQTETASFMDRLPIRDSRVLCVICCHCGAWQHALVRSLHFAVPLIPLLFQTTVSNSSR